MKSSVKRKQKKKRKRKPGGLKSVRLRNFKRHKDLTIEFDPKITTIVGPTDAGKSAIISALDFCLLNRNVSNSARILPGDKGTKRRASVQLDLDETDRIERIKGKSRNEYRLDGRSFKSFGSSVPEPIRAVAGVVSENIQTQLEPHFWLTLSPGQLAKELNRVVDLDVIDKSLKHIADQVREKRVEKRVCEERHAQAKKEVKELAWFKEFKRDAEALLALESRYGVLSDKINSAAVLIADANSARLRADSLQIAILEGSRAVQIGRNAIELAKRRAKLRKTVKKVIRLQKLTKDVPDIRELQRARERADAMSKKRGDLEEAIDRLQVRRKIEAATEKELDELNTQLKSMKKVCPTCNRPL